VRLIARAEDKEMRDDEVRDTIDFTNNIAQLFHEREQRNENQNLSSR
jgi:hypothetical protein